MFLSLFDYGVAIIQLFLNLNLNLKLELYDATCNHDYLFVSEHVINSGGVSFSLSYPMPLSPALPPLSYPVTSQKSFFSSGTTQASPLASTVQPVQSSLSHAPPAWPSQSGIDEDYDAWTTNVYVYFFDTSRYQF